MKTSITASLAIAALVAAVSIAANAQTTFSVDPLIVTLGAQTSSAVLTITNPTTREIRFEIKGFAWDQAPPTGEMKLTPSQDLAIFPPLVSIRPKTIQRVRVGTTATSGAVEKSYRIMIEELPSGDAPPATNQVNVRTRVGIPVFIEPTRTVRSGTIGDVSIRNQTVSVTLRNTGTTYAMVDNVVIRGMSGPDEMVFEQTVPGWYVLAGKSRTWQYNFKPTQCAKSKFVEIEAYAHDKLLTTRADMPAGACTP